jgi:hypothetical protein
MSIRAEKINRIWFGTTFGTWQSTCPAAFR